MMLSPIWLWLKNTVLEVDGIVVADINWRYCSFDSWFSWIYCLLRYKNAKNQGEKRRNQEAKEVKL